jgi:hypothetical protein
MKLIETKTLGTAAASIEFTSIPQTFTDLVLKVSTRSAVALGSGGHYYTVIFNNNTSNRSARDLEGQGGNGFVGSGVFVLYGASSHSGTTANTFSNGEFYIPNYSGSTNKSASGDTVYENNASDGRQYIVAGLWSDTSAITTITLTQNAGNFVSGSTVSLYGITKGSDGIVTTS